MIRLQRNTAPSDLGKRKVKLAMDELIARHKRGEKILGNTIKSHWSSPQIRNALSDMQQGKCCYCDRTRDAAREMDIDHFRPKATPKEAPKHPGYWWLAYSWENILLSCKTCNAGAKSNHFPVRARSIRARPLQNVSREKPLLLNPALDDCETSIIYNWETIPVGVFLKPRRGDARARKTIEILQLNRTALARERAIHFRMVLNPIAKAIKAAEKKGRTSELTESVKRLGDAITTQPFAGLARAYFRAEKLHKYM